ncbi:hypothetical protein ASAC_0327 [Acidilobus saccharovorans 345-15]|uniref:Methyltransferase domain-containing protein n=1 Tax=Acidilobus saccharovorans (strain DSM 16705 / JCM 18335 / VKM B-2471 / 345-15) TaxID=666510 RepID=D9Q096_ACIS3|nr:methyltransferase domain-containing protein [Acidilobus saccharovorans]ADL18734.1 hypothetical protein ASAC_0327 [Acidilobus saccharovorans 345-15]
MNRHDLFRRHLMSPVDVSLLEPLRLQPGMTVVDLGSGPGRFTIPVAKIVAPGKVYAVDIDKESLRIVAEKASEEGLSNVEVVEADATQGVGLPDNVADVVIMANVLHDFIHEGVSQAVLRTAVRLLKRGGRLAVYEFKKGSLSFGPPQWLRVDPEKVIEELRAAGLASIDVIQNVNETHYLVIGVKP